MGSAAFFFFFFFGVSPCHDRDFSQLGLLFELLLIFTEKGLRDLHVFTFYLHFKKKKKKEKGHKEKTPICLDGRCFLLFTDAVFKPRGRALGCDPSLETQSQLLASAHPWLPASRDITKEACSQTRRAVRGEVTRYPGVQQFPIEGNHSKGSLSRSPPGSSGTCRLYRHHSTLGVLSLAPLFVMHHKLVCKTRIQAQVTYLEMGERRIGTRPKDDQ